jgi:tRNA pseudouridine55 synthase
MAELRRTAACGFGPEDAVTLEQVIAAVERGEGESLLRPVDTVFAHLPAITVLGKNESKVRNGLAFSLPTAAEGDYRVYNQAGEFLMVGRVTEGKLTTVKNFFEVS